MKMEMEIKMKNIGTYIQHMNRRFNPIVVKSSMEALDGRILIGRCGLSYNIDLCKIFSSNRWNEVKGK